MDFVARQLSAACVSLTVAGNSGISSFLTLFLLGMVGLFDPSVLPQSGVGSILSSIPCLVGTGCLSVVEILSMCIPVLDVFMDSAKTVIVPMVSIVGMAGTFGLYGTHDNSNSSDRDLGVASQSYHAVLWTIQGAVFFVGVGVSITIHLFKMIMRLAGQGCLTQCFAATETTTTILSLLLALLIRTMAVTFAVIFLSVAAFHWYKKWKRRRKLAATLEEKRNLHDAVAEKTEKGEKSAPKTTDYVLHQV